VTLKRPPDDPSELADFPTKTVAPGYPYVRIHRHVRDPEWFCGRAPDGDGPGIGDRGSVLPGVEQHHAIAVLNDVGVNGPGSGPLSRGEQPPEHRSPRRRHMVGSDLHVAGAHNRHSAYRIVDAHLFYSFRPAASRRLGDVAALLR
jgi:hypothetical protein